MAGQIRLNIEGLESSYNQLLSRGNELEEWINEVTNVINSLDESWEGDAAVAYQEQFESLRPGLNDTRQLIEDIAKQIQETLQSVQDLDANIASKMR